jgi:hypothetical protein
LKNQFFHPEHLGASPRLSDGNALDLIERNLILPFVLKLRRQRRFMIGDMLRPFQISRCSSGGQKSRA